MVSDVFVLPFLEKSLDLTACSVRQLGKNALLVLLWFSQDPFFHSLLNVHVKGA